MDGHSGVKLFPDFNVSYIIHNCIYIVLYISRGHKFNLNDIRSILDIISANAIPNKEDIARLNILMDKANITSNQYGQLMNAV